MISTELKSCESLRRIKRRLVRTITTGNNFGSISDLSNKAKIVFSLNKIISYWTEKNQITSFSVQVKRATFFMLLDHQWFPLTVSSESSRTAHTIIMGHPITTFRTVVRWMTKMWDQSHIKWSILRTAPEGTQDLPAILKSYTNCHNYLFGTCPVVFPQLHKVLLWCIWRLNVYYI